MPLDIWGYYSGPGNYPASTAADIELRTLLGAADCLTNGITTVQDMVTIPGGDRAQLDAILEGYRSSASASRWAFRSQTGSRPKPCLTGTRSAGPSASAFALR